MVTDSSPKKICDNIVKYIWQTNVNEKSQRPSERDNNGENGSQGNEETSKEIWNIVNDILGSAMSECEDKYETDRVILRKSDKFNNLNVRDKHARRCVSECVISENVVESFNPIFKFPESTKPKRKHRLSFSSFFHKKVIPKIHEDKHGGDDSEEEEPTEEVYKRRDSLRMSQKFHSALEIGSKSTLHRTPSFIKRIINFGEESKSFLKRSISFRDIIKKDKSKEDLTKSKLEEWRHSMKSLAESDLSVSCQDFSYVDYDIHNDISYGDDSLENIPEGSVISRSQSVIVRVSSKRDDPASLIIFLERSRTKNAKHSMDLGSIFSHITI